MVNLTRAEREARIERDDGDPAATVYRAEWGGRADGHYHDDRTCPNLEQAEGEPVAYTRGLAQDRLYPPCLLCVLEADLQSDEQTRSLRARLADEDDEVEFEYEFQWDREYDGDDAESEVA